MSLTVWLIVGISVLSIAAFQRPELLQKLLFHPYSVKHRNEYYRFVTSGLVHSGWVHLLFNMFTLYFFGGVVEYIFNHPAVFGSMGNVYYLALFFFGVIIADIPSFVRYKDLPHFRSLGASGGVAAVVFCSIMFNPIQDIWIFGIFPLPGFILGPLFLVYSYYQDKKGTDHINHSAHLYGALFGVLFAFFARPTVFTDFFDQVINYQF